MVIAPKKFDSNLARLPPSSPAIAPSLEAASPISSPAANPAMPAPTPVICFANCNALTLNAVKSPAMVVITVRPETAAGVIPLKKLFTSLVILPPSRPAIASPIGLIPLAISLI